MVMSNSVKSYKLEIFNDQYTLLSDESEKHLEKSAALVDKYMKEIADRVTTKDVSRIAVLAAIRLASTVLYREAELEEKQQYETKLIALIDEQLNKQDLPI